MVKLAGNADRHANNVFKSALDEATIRLSNAEPIDTKFAQEDNDK